MTQIASEPTAAAPWRPDDGTFGMRLAMIRQHMRWGNVAEAARECGVPTDSWRNWEEGMEPRRLITIAMAIAGRTGVDVDWLVYGRAKEAVRPNGRYPRDLADLMAHVSGARVVARVGHGDGRRSRYRAKAAPTVTTPQVSRRPPKRQQSRPVSRVAMA